MMNKRCNVINFLKKFMSITEIAFCERISVTKKLKHNTDSLNSRVVNIIMINLH